MGLSSLASVGLSYAQNQQTQANAKAQADAVVQQGAIDAQNRARQTQLAVGTQTSRFLASGFQLVGTPQADATGTYATGLADTNNIISNANQKSQNIYTQARTTMLANLTKSASGLGLGGLDLSQSLELPGVGSSGNAIGQDVGSMFSSSPTGPYQPFGS